MKSLFSTVRAIAAGFVVGAVFVAAAAATPKAEAYIFRGCKWNHSQVKVSLPSVYLSYSVQIAAAASFAGLDGRPIVNTGSPYDAYAGNENRGNTVTWTGILRKRFTLETKTDCVNGYMVSGQVEIILNWSKLDSLGYSSAKRQGVSAHEMGHMLGLAHISHLGSPGILMFPYDTRTTNVPTSDDQAGINALY